MKPILTVFTPTYNRAHCLFGCYQSMQYQSNKNFIWLIIDDGSTDNTKELVESWQSEDNDFEIVYVKKENGGLHTGYNKAIELCETELIMCVDSDDYLANGAIDKILEFWKNNGSLDYCGIIGLDVDKSNKPIAKLPRNQKKINLIDLLVGRYPEFEKGDKKLVLRTELLKQVAPMKSFDNEKNFNPHYMHLQISRDKDCLILNEPLCVVDYQRDGMTANIFKQYYNSPKSFLQTRKLYLSFENLPFKFRIKQYIHYVSSALLAKEKHIIRNSPNPFLALLLFPLGFMLKSYIIFKSK